MDYASFASIPVWYPFTTAIICAYNEENTVGQVVKCVLSHPAIDKVIVVNDGSTDNTLREIEFFKSDVKMEILSWQQNRGKGYAMATAAKASSDGVLLFIDSDLKGFTHDHIDILLQPIYHYKMVLGCTPKKFLDLFMWITGTRALWKKDFIPVAELIKTSGYGVETILNGFIGRDKMLAVELPGLVHIRKHEKDPLTKCWKNYVLEAKDIYIAYQNQFISNIIRVIR